MTVIVTAHAIQRYRERISDQPDDAVRDYLNRIVLKRQRAFEAANKIGCRRFRLKIKGGYIACEKSDGAIRIKTILL